MQEQTTEPQKIFGLVDLSRGRDFELVDFIGRQGVVAIEHVMVRLGVREAAAYRRVAACIERGLLERIELLRREPSLIRATRAGLRYAGLGLPVAVISPGVVDHWLRCATTAALLAAEFGPERVISERELRAAERLEGRAIASAKLGELPSGHPRLHRPDLVVFAESGVTAIEVELTPKAPHRLLSIIRAWRGAECVDAVRYYCAPGPTRRGVERAVAKAYAASRVEILEAVARR
jgi:hypothetical protein